MQLSRLLTVVGCHAGGEVGDVVTGGIGNVPGRTVFEKREYLQEHLDHLRKLLLFEPRGAMVRSVNFVVPAGDSRAQLGFITAESTEYPVMSGGNIICTATVLLETGMLPMQEPTTNVVLESGAGLIPLHCECSQGKVTSVEFTNQPAFVYHLDAPVEVGGLGTVRVDAAWGGMAYAIVAAQDLGFGLTPDEGRDLCRVGQQIKMAAAEQLKTVHPENEKYAGITNLCFTGPQYRNGNEITSRNTVVVSPGRLDRCPCGTGTSARLAVMHARGEIGLGDRFVSESIIGARFRCTIVSTTTVGDHPAVVPTIAGEAWITGISQVGYDPSDPFPAGYTLSDTWLATP